MTTNGTITACPGCGQMSAEDYDGRGRCWSCHNGAKPNGGPINTAGEAAMRDVMIRAGYDVPDEDHTEKVATPSAPPVAVPPLASSTNGSTASIEAASRKGGKVATPLGSAPPCHLPKLRRLDVARMVREEPPPVPWVIEGLVVRGALTVLNGREGEGKSLLAMALAAGVALGENQAGLDCRTGRVLIVDCENGAYETHRRVHALGLPGLVEMYEPDDGKRFDLRTDLADLERLLVQHTPDLLILDSFRTLWGGEENDSGEVAKVLDPLRNLVRNRNAGTILLHHSGKGTNSGYRGSSAIGASAELGFTLARDEGDDDRDRRSLACWKCRPAPKPAKAWLRLSVERGMVLIDQAEPPEDEPPTKAPVTGSLKPRVLAVLTDQPQARADIARTVGRDPKDRSVGRVLDDLAAEGMAEKDAGKWAAKRWQGGNPPRADATCHPAEGVGDGLDDPLASALEAEQCRCPRPLSLLDDDGEPHCTRCGHAVAGWS